MGKAQKKTGKGRIDKYYKLAKEQGYRARSAFKLIQLNKKYGFLETSRCCIDLCAAPGGWLQVASKYMPVNSLIVGVDLVPIKPIPCVVTFTADITTPQCRNLLRNELKDWKADVVLHDGAPNVGTAWVQDAYSQSELVLMSLKLAVEFLIKGGTFITKVFRSVDYNNLIWVFNQLFGKVEATKPPSSRNVSAEIYVVCREYLAPRHIDPKFLDPRHVFKDLAASIPSEKGTSATNVQANVFHPEKKRRQREGYAEGDYTLFKTIPASDFIKGSDPIAILGSCNKITFTTDEEKQWLTLQVTTGDVKANCEDLKVLGKGDFKTLMKWRLALRQELGLEVKEKEMQGFTETGEVMEGVDDDQQIQEELERLDKEAQARAKRARRRANELKARATQRMQLQMVAPLDIGLEQGDATLHIGQDDTFGLSTTERAIRKKREVELLTENDGSSDNEEESNDENGLDVDGGNVDEDSDTEGEKEVRGLEAELDGMYDAYQNRQREKDSKFKAQEAREKNRTREEWRGINGKESDDEDEDTAGEADESSSEGGWDAMEETKLKNSDESDESSDSETSEDEKEEFQKRKRTFPQGLADKPPKRQRLITDLQGTGQTINQAARLWFSRDVFADEGGLEVESDEEHENNHSMDAPSELDRSEGDDDIEIVPQESGSDDHLWGINDKNEDAVKTADTNKFGLLTPEAITLAQQLVNREKTKTQLINDGFNRYSLNSKEGLPSWFLDDEAKHYKSNIPITKEAVVALRAKQRALDARPIKKIAEAKARKKMKAAQRLEKAMKKAEGVNETTELTEREKARQIEKLMRNGMSSGKKKKEVKLVVAKGPHKGIKGRPKGVKGRYTMVDARMKKEVRARKEREKSKRSRRRA